jgi:hypothetical protein
VNPSDKFFRGGASLNGLTNNLDALFGGKVFRPRMSCGGGNVPTFFKRMCWKIKGCLSKLLQPYDKE